MAKKIVEPDATGKLRPERLKTGASHTLVARSMELDHRYHDDDPIQEAKFTVKFSNGFELSGKLDKNGKATLIGVPASGVVRYGPDAREYKRVDDRKNPDHRESFGDAEFEALYAKYQK